MYNLTQLTEAQNLQDIVSFSNVVTEPVSIMGMLMVAIFFILIIVFMKYGIESALVTSAFMSFILSAILAWGGMIAMFYPLMFLAITSFTYLYMVFTDYTPK